ncbi:hypothetical protein CHUAL_013311 [Chamberlinius hualienensis]
MDNAKNKENKSTLLSVFTIFRHGSKAPIIIGDHEKHIWPEGPSNLTKEGKLQAYKLGEKYRRQYKGFISSEYHDDELYVCSTDTNRCLLSAECCAAGLFPPTVENKWHPTLNWQPIPIHTRSVDTDPLYPVHTHGLSVEDFYNKYVKPHHPDSYQNYISNKSIWAKWLQFTSKDGSSNLLQLATVLDGIRIRMSQNLPYDLPPGLDVTTFAPICLQSLKLLASTFPPHAKLGCEFLTNVLDRFNGLINGSHKTRLFLYCSHDIAIWSVFEQLNTDVQHIDHCGYIAFELHKLLDEKYYFRLQRCENLQSEAYDILLDGKTVFYPWEKFKELVRASQMKIRNYTPI